MTNRELAAWLKKATGEILVPVLVPHDIQYIRAYKDDLIHNLMNSPDEPAQWEVTKHFVDDCNPRRNTVWLDTTK